MNLRRVNGPTPYAAFGTCYACRTNSPGADFVATGIDISGEGELEFCENCLGDIAEAIGHVKPQTVARLKGEVKKLREEVAELRATAKAHTSLVGALQAVGVRVKTSSKAEVAQKDAE